MEKLFPSSLVINGITFELDYQTCSDQAIIKVSEEFARNTSLKQVVHPNGFILKLSCDECFYLADSFSELVEMIDEEKSKKEFQQAQKEQEVHGLKDLPTIFFHLPKLKNPLMVNGTEYCFYFSGINEFSFELIRSDRQERVNEINAHGLKNLYRYATTEALKVPDNGIFYEDNLYFWKRKLSVVGDYLQNRFNALTEKHSRGLSVDNVEEKINNTIQEAEALLTQMAENEKFCKFGLRELSFEFLISNKWVEEFTILFSSLQEELEDYSEEVIVKAIYEITKRKDGMAIRGNKLWISLKKKYPVAAKKDFPIKIFDLAFAIMEMIEKEDEDDEKEDDKLIAA